MKSFETITRWIRERFNRVALLLLVIVAWFVANAFNLLPTDIIPTPAKLWATTLDLKENGNLLLHIGKSLTRVFVGFLFGGSLGFLLGVSMGLSRTVEKIFGPIFHAIRQVPLLGWMPLIVLWCGIGETSKIVFIAIGALYPMTLNTFEGIRSISKEYLEVAQVFEFRRLRLITTIILPAALPNIVTGIKFSLTVAWMLVVGAEIFSVSAGGLGDMIWAARELFRMDIVIVGLIIITLIGIVLSKTVGIFETHFLQWRKTTH